jgi:hypothetical protein
VQGLTALHSMPWLPWTVRKMTEGRATCCAGWSIKLEEFMATFRITMKDPDYSIDATCADVSVLEAFLEYDEYITVEFDTKKCTARVVPIRELKD